MKVTVEKQAQYFKNWYENGGKERLKRKRQGDKSLLKKSYAYRAKHPERKKAYYAVYDAIELNRLNKPKRCASCGEEKYLHGHHADYTKKLEVVWLCVRCHKSVH